MHPSVKQEKYAIAIVMISVFMQMYPTSLARILLCYQFS